jgi:Tetratricopeptide repeat
MLGERHPDTLTSMSNLAWTYESPGRLMEASELMQQAVERSKMALGEQHPDTVHRQAKLRQLSNALHRVEMPHEDGARLCINPFPHELTNEVSVNIVSLRTRVEYLRSRIYKKR